MKKITLLSSSRRFNIQGLSYLLLFLLIPLNSFAAEAVTIDFFWIKGCPHCDHEKGFLSQLEKDYPNVKINSYELVKHMALAKKMTRSHGTRWKDVGPQTFIDNKHWVGFSESTAKQIRDFVKKKSTVQKKTVKRGPAGFYR